MQKVLVSSYAINWIPLYSHPELPETLREIFEKRKKLLKIKRILNTEIQTNTGAHFFI